MECDSNVLSRQHWIKSYIVFFISLFIEYLHTFGNRLHACRLLPLIWNHSIRMMEFFFCKFARVFQPFLFINFWTPTKFPLRPPWIPGIVSLYEYFQHFTRLGLKGFMKFQPVSYYSLNVEFYWFYFVKVKLPRKYSKLRSAVFTNKPKSLIKSVYNLG